eukprot:470186_1
MDDHKDEKIKFENGFAAITDKSSIITKCTGQILSKFNDGTESWQGGTGTVFKKLNNKYYILVTCAHNIVKYEAAGDTGLEADDIIFFPDPTNRKIQMKGIMWYYPKGQHKLDAKHCAYDIALIVVYDEKNNYFSKSKINDKIKLKDSISMNDERLIKCNINGYPVDLNDKLCGMSGDAVLFDDKTEFNYSNITTYPGQSGSAIFIKDDKNKNSFNIFGIHTYGDKNTQSNWGVQLNDDKLRWINRHIDEIQKIFKKIVVEEEKEDLEKSRQFADELFKLNIGFESVKENIGTTHSVVDHKVRELNPVDQQVAENALVVFTIKNESSFIIKYKKPELVAGSQLIKPAAYLKPNQECAALFRYSAWDEKKEKPEFSAVLNFEYGPGNDDYMQNIHFMVWSTFGWAVAAVGIDPDWKYSYATKQAFDELKDSVVEFPNYRTGNRSACDADDNKQNNPLESKFTRAEGKDILIDFLTRKIDTKTGVLPVEIIFRDSGRKIIKTKRNAKYIFDEWDYKSWDVDTIVNWIISLNEKEYKNYKDVLSKSLYKNGIDKGSKFCPAIEDLKDWGVKDIHCKHIFKESAKLILINKGNGLPPVKLTSGCTTEQRWKDIISAPTYKHSARLLHIINRSKYSLKNLTVDRPKDNHGIMRYDINIKGLEIKPNEEIFAMYQSGPEEDQVQQINKNVKPQKIKVRLTNLNLIMDVENKCKVAITSMLQRQKYVERGNVTRIILVLNFGLYNWSTAKEIKSQQAQADQSSFNFVNIGYDDIHIVGGIGGDDLKPITVIIYNKEELNKNQKIPNKNDKTAKHGDKNDAFQTDFIISSLDKTSQSQGGNMRGIFDIFK